MAERLPEPAVAFHIFAINAAGSRMTEAARWYNAVVRDCNLSKASFQLANGNIPLGVVSTALWSIFDCVPPKSIENYDPTPGNVFSTNYGAILESLVQKGLASAALSIWNKAGGFTSVKAYDGTIMDLQSELNSVPGATVEMRVREESDSLEGCWAQSSTQDQFGFLEIPADQRKPIPAAAPPMGTIVKVRFEKILTFVAGPLSKCDPLNPGLKDYLPWYNSAALNLALSDQSAWSNPNQWSIYFDKNSGSMLRSITSIVVVDGVTTTTVQPVTVSKSELATSAAKPCGVGFWPFAIPPTGLDNQGPGAPASSQGVGEPNAGKELHSDVTISSLSMSSHTISSPTGNPLLLGVNVRTL